MRSTPVNSINASALAASIPSHQHQIDALQAGFTAQASNSNFLAAMTVASSAFSLGRTLGASLFSGVLRGAALQGSAFSVGFAAEILSFRGANQILTPGSESWLNASGLASTATDFLMMKGAGVFCGTSSYGVRQLVQAGAMVGGEYAGESMGVREHSGQAFSARFAHALATGVAMDAGGVLARVGAGGRMEALQRNLDRQASARVQAPEGRDQQVQSSPQMAANSQRADYIAGLIKGASADRNAAVTLMEYAQSNASSFQSEHLGPMIEAARSVPKLAEALVYVAFGNGKIFEGTHITSMIEVGKTQFMLRRALFPLARDRSKQFTSENLTDVLAYQEHPGNSVVLVVHNLWTNRGLDFFTRDHVPGVIALTKTRSEGISLSDGASLLEKLVNKRPELFRAGDLPAMAEAAGNNIYAINPLGKLLERIGEAGLSWDTFVDILRVDEATHDRNGSEYSVLYQFTREHFDYFTPERLAAIIEAAKTQWVAAGILQNLVGVSIDRGERGIELGAMHPGLNSEHVPGIIEAAAVQEPAALALDGLAYWRQTRRLVTVEHYPAIIEAATRNPRLGTVLGALVFSDKNSFTRDHLPGMVEAAQSSDSAANALYGLISNRPDLAGEVALPAIITAAKERAGMAILLGHFAKDRPSAFGPEHLPGMIEAAGSFAGSGLALRLVLNRSPEWMTPDNLVRMVEVAEAQFLKLEAQSFMQVPHAVITILNEFSAGHHGVFTPAHIRRLLDQAGDKYTTAVVLYQLANRPELFTEKDCGDMLRFALTQETLVGSLWSLREAGLVATRGNMRSLILLGAAHQKGAGLLGNEVKYSSDYFEREDLPSFIESAKAQREAALALNTLVQKRPELATPRRLREIMAILAKWAENRPSS